MSRNSRIQNRHYKMFESDDFDQVTLGRRKYSFVKATAVYVDGIILLQVLSQFEFPEDVNTTKCSEDKQLPVQTFANKQVLGEELNDTNNKTRTTEGCNKANNNEETQIKPVTNDNKIIKDIVSPKHVKRKMIHSYFDHKSKRKFPGPAGLLNGGFEQNHDETICQMELLSQVSK